MATIRWTLAAVDDLDKVASYIAIDNPAVAHSVATEIYDAPSRLERFPRSGERLPQFRGEVRQILKHGYRIVYQVVSDVCWVVAIVHASRDIDSALIGRIIESN
jgi:toxin ParE1/3/4